MKKILSLLAAVLIFGSVWAQDAPAYSKVRLQFSGTTANSTNVSVVDQNGSAISGASASLIGIQKKNGTNDPVSCTLQTQNGHLLTPQYDNSPGNGWILTFQINGLDTQFGFNTAAVDLHAMNAQGGYQNDSNIKYWTANLSVGATEATVADFGTSERYGISDPKYQDGSTRHVVATIVKSEAVNYVEGMIVKLYVKKEEGGGCFCGIKYLELYNEVPTTYTYTLNVVGADDATVSVAGADYTTGQTIESVGKTLTAEDVTPAIVEGKRAAVTVSDDAITVTYSNDAWAGKYVSLQNKMHGYYLSIYNNENLSGTTEKDVNNTWQLVATGIGYKLYNPVAELYASPIVQRNKGILVTADAANAGVYDFEADGEYYDLKCKNGASTGYAYFHGVNWAGSTPQYQIVDWSYGVDASRWTITEEEYSPITKATVTYKYVVDGTPIAHTSTSEGIVGQAPAEPAGFDFATVTSDAASQTVAGNGSTVVTVQVTQELPFELGDGNDQFLHRGFLHVHSNQGRYMYFDWDDDAEAMMVYDTENYETGSGLNKKLTMDFPSSASTCKWHITGNVVEGFKLYNDTYEFVLAATAPQASMLSVDDPANGENPGTAFVLKRSTAGVGEFNFKRGFCLYAPEQSKFLNAQGQMMYWKDADAGSTFEFEESYDVTIGQEGLATLYYHTPLSLDNVEGLTAYTLTLEGDYLVANETSTIPAYTGVVLAGEAKTYTLPVAFENVPGMGALTGSYTEKNTPENCYVLSKDGDDACFAKYTGAKLGEFKAYFIGEATSASNLRISFGELNSIISAAKENGGQAIYDLQGRRVVSAKGISIVNGKKVIK